jgi:hypothetical protein
VKFVSFILKADLSYLIKYAGLILMIKNLSSIVSNECSVCLGLYVSRFQRARNLLTIEKNYCKIRHVGLCGSVGRAV